MSKSFLKMQMLAASVAVCSLFSSDIYDEIEARSSIFISRSRLICTMWRIFEVQNPQIIPRGLTKRG